MCTKALIPAFSKRNIFIKAIKTSVKICVEDYKCVEFRGAVVHLSLIEM